MDKLRKQSALSADARLKSATSILVAAVVLVLGLGVVATYCEALPFN